MAESKIEDAGLLPDPQNISVPTKPEDFKYNELITFGKGNKGTEPEVMFKHNDPTESAWMIGNNILGPRKKNDIVVIGKDSKGELITKEPNTRHKLMDNNGTLEEVKNIYGGKDESGVQKRSEAWDAEGRKILSLRTTERTPSTVPIK